MTPPSPTSSPAPTDLPELTLDDATAWREWLGEHCQSAPGVWLVLAKKGTTDPTPVYSFTFSACT